MSCLQEQKYITSFNGKRSYCIQKEFVIWQCQQCTLRFTQDVPSEDSIKDYYKAEEYISHTDTSKGLVNKLYKKVRQYTLQQKSNLIISETGVKEGSILDFGCGTGSFADVMKQKGWKVTGIEPDEDARKRAKELYDLDVLPHQHLKIFHLNHLMLLPYGMFWSIYTICIIM
jgi:2-polyprenyl-3-methyl-5-hydroxy-6-metoxy-1,4-benzoquinol methylase